MKERLKIRYLSDYPEHIPVLAKWLYDEWNYMYPEISVESAIGKLTERLNKVIIPTAFVALHDKEPVGTSSLIQYDMDSHNHLSPWLASLFVRPDKRKRGIGTLLVCRAVAEAEAIGVEKLYLFTPNMRRFYERLGWQVIETPMYRGQPVFIMVREVRGER